MTIKPSSRLLCAMGFLLILASCGGGEGTSLGTPVGNAPDPEAEKINTQGWADSPWISGDGQRLYFMYSRYNFFPFINSTGPPELRGPDRPGHHDDNINPFGDSDVYVAERQPDGSWSKPVNMGFNDNLSDCCHIIVSAPTRVYYTKPIGGSQDIGYKEQQLDGSWGSFVSLGPNINSPFNEDNPHVTADQQRIYFTRWDASDQRDIWFSFQNLGVWQPAVKLGAPINSVNPAVNEDQFWISEPSGVTSEVYFTQDDQIYHSVYTAGIDTFSIPVLVPLGLLFTGEPSLTDDGLKLYFAAGFPGTEEIKVMVSDRQPDLSWGAPVPVD